jgi:neurotransmitter:Na+ symporter, NSS family
MQQETLIDAAQVGRAMAGGANGRTFVLALLGAGLAATLLRFPFGRAADGAWFLGFAAIGLFVVALPVVLGEGALGQFRRRNAVDALGPGAWKGVGFLSAIGALVLAALVAVLAGWSARFVILSFSESWTDDPARHFRLLSAGPDAVLATFGVVVVAAGFALRGTRNGSKGLVGFATVAALLVLAGLAAWSWAFAGSAAGRAGMTDVDLDEMDASVAAAGLLAGLLPALLATGVTVDLSGQLHDRTMPREGTLVGLFAAVAIFAAVLFLAGLATSQGLALAQGNGLDAFTMAPQSFAAVGGWEGGMLAGFFFGALLLLALVALLALLEVPATWIHERFDSWSEGRAFVATASVVLLLALPLCFGADAVLHTSQALAWILAPLFGLFVSAHVGWARPEVLDGFRVGDAKHPLGDILRPLLRYVHPPVFALLLVAGTLGFLRAIGWADGTDGLWALAP